MTLHNNLRRKLLGVAIPLLTSLALGVSTSALQAQELSPLEKIKKDGVLKVAVYNNLFPFSDKGKGIDVDLAEALAKEMGVAMRLLPFDADESFNDDLRNMVWRGSLFGYGPGDVLMHSPIDDYLIKNEDKVLFFGAYTREEIYVAHNLQAFPRLDSLSVLLEGDGKVGAEVASISSEVLAGADSRAYVEKLVNFQTIPLALKALLNGEIQAVMGTRSELEAGLHNAPNAKDFYISKVRHNSLPPKGWAVGMAVKAGSKDVAQALNAALESLQAKGEVEKIFAKYGVTYRKP